MRVQNTPKIDRGDIPKEIYEAKFTVTQTGGVGYTGRHGILQDPRVVLGVLKELI